MLIALVGTRSSGKTAVQDYLVLKHGFKVIGLTVDASATQNEASTEENEDRESWQDDDQDSDIISFPGVGNRESFLSMDISSPTTPYTARYARARAFEVTSNPSALSFGTPNEMLDFATRNWRERLVTLDLHQQDVIEDFAIRPFFMLINVDAPIMRRYERCRRETDVSLEDFVTQDDRAVHGYKEMTSAMSQPPSTPLNNLRSLVHLHVVNDFSSLDQLHSFLDSLDILDQDRLRPAWDTYFMRLASLASLRSNCMKRCVGAILVRDKRIVSTGYNGTARGLRNCNEGGCPRCNGSSPSGHGLDECVCLHAEENALLEAGRERSDGTVLYCNTCPCLRCTVKIIQTGVKEVVYNLSYRMDDSSAALFKEAGIILRRHAPPPWSDK